jgi:hypothetical protein
MGPLWYYERIRSFELPVFKNPAKKIQKFAFLICNLFLFKQKILLRDEEPEMFWSTKIRQLEPERVRPTASLAASIFQPYE